MLKFQTKRIGKLRSDLIKLSTNGDIVSKTSSRNSRKTEDYACASTSLTVHSWHSSLLLLLNCRFVNSAYSHFYAPKYIGVLYINLYYLGNPIVSHDHNDHTNRVQWLTDGPTPADRVVFNEGHIGAAAGSGHIPIG